MKKNQPNESQQSSQGIAIGTQGNQGGTMPVGNKGPNRSREEREDKIPNQERSVVPKNKEEKNK